MDFVDDIVRDIIGVLAAVKSGEPDFYDEDKHIKACVLLDDLSKGYLCFEPEYWHSSCTDPSPLCGESDANASASECLLRFSEEAKIDSRAAMFEAIEYIYACGCEQKFDILVFAMASWQAEQFDMFPVSINLSPLSACGTEFWRRAEAFMYCYGAENYIIEVLENEVEGLEGLDVSYLEWARGMGALVALDDFQGSASSEYEALRFKVFGKLCDIIKLDGSLVESWEQGDRAPLNAAVHEVRDVNPDAVLLAERVNTPELALELREELGVALVQGRDTGDVNAFSEKIQKYMRDRSNGVSRFLGGLVDLGDSGYVACEKAQKTPCATL